MDEIILEKINQKIQESVQDKTQILQIINALDIHSRNFKMGLLVGRIYNSFHYQTRRILKRDPTNEEFLEFLEFLKSKKSELGKNY